MRKLLALLVIALLGGCAASITPSYDTRFGDAVRQSRQRMTLNPNAGANPDPVAGMDGGARATPSGGTTNRSRRRLRS